MKKLVKPNPFAIIFSICFFIAGLIALSTFFGEVNIFSIISFTFLSILSRELFYSEEFPPFPKIKKKGSKNEF